MSIKEQITRECKQCGAKFLFRGCPTDISSGRGKYCSKKCVNESERTLPKEFTCKFCSKVFPNKYGKIKKYCSKICADKARIGTVSPMKGRKASLETRRKQSQKRMGVVPWNKGKPNPKIRGENNVFWKGGISHRSIRTRDMGRIEYKNWKKAVFERDNYSCVLCGAKENLQVDHIQMVVYFPWLRHDVNNGQVLCKECHKAKTKDDLIGYHRTEKALRELVKEGKVEVREVNIDGFKAYQYRLCRTQ